MTHFSDEDYKRMFNQPSSAEDTLVQLTPVMENHAKLMMHYMNILAKTGFSQSIAEKMMLLYSEAQWHLLHALIYDNVSEAEES